MATFNGKVIDGGLNMRKTASSSATILVQIPEGTSLTLIEESGKTAWFKTTYGSYTGYVMAAYIAITDDGGTCKVTTASGDLNIRKTPSSSASVLYKAAQNSVIRLLDCTSDADWYRVSSADGTGWAMSDYLTILTKPGEEETPTVSSDTTATVRYNSVTCYKSAEMDESNVWGTFAINTSIPVWFVDSANEYYKTTWTVNGVNQVGYVYSEDVTLVEDNSGVLSNGSSCNSVINCKWKLYELGYHPREFKSTFSSVTEAAVKVFQEKNNLTVNGTIDSSTRTAMYASSTKTWIEAIGGAWTSRTAPHQWFMGDSKWASHAFPADANPDGTIEMDGNSITAMAMLLTAFSDSVVTPVEMAEFALAEDYRDQSGQTGVKNIFYTQIGEHYDCVEYTGTVTSLTSVETHLNQNGTLAIIEVNDNLGTFTGGASQLVCYNIDGYVYALSPNSNKNPDPFTLAEWEDAGWFVTAYLYSICNG